MERYVGLDSHARSCTLGVMSASGQRLKSLVVETNGALAEMEAPFAAHLHCSTDVTWAQRRLDVRGVRKRLAP